MPEVMLEGLFKIYPSGVWAVSNLNLTIHDGELLVLVGPSGCGKTTTLRLLAGLEIPTRGVIRIGGQIINAWSPRQRNVAMVFQRPALYPHRTVRDNLAFSLALQQPGRLGRLLLRLSRPRRYSQALKDAGTVTERVEETARLLSLEGVLDRFPPQLSGGEQQRVALGRALVRRPGLLLLDEPLSNLDAGLRLELRRELHLLHRRFPATMVYVTHDPVEALTLGDRVAVLKEGHLEQVDFPQALYDRPRNRFVGGFVGWPPMSFLDGQLVCAEGRFVFTTLGGEVPLPVSRLPGRDWHTSQRLTLGIRPEHVTWHEEAAGGDLPMEVALVETLGRGRLVTFAARGQQVTALTTPDDGVPLVEGQKVMVSLQTNQVHLFDPATGLALGTG
jgi:multiple sugar transport system ATP-binding protein